MLLRVWPAWLTYCGQTAVCKVQHNSLLCKTCIVWLHALISINQPPWVCECLLLNHAVMTSSRLCITAQGHRRSEYLSRSSALPAVLPSLSANSPAPSMLQPAVLLVHRNQLSAVELLTAAMLRAVALKAAVLQGLTCLLCLLWDL